MTSIQDFSDCPRCGLLGSYIYYSGSGNYSFQCVFCGFEKEIIYFSEIDPNEDPLCPEESRNSNDYTVHISEINPVGAICIVTKKGGAQFDCRPPRADRDAINEFKKIMENPDVDPKRSYLTRWDPGKRKLVYLMGHPSRYWKREIDSYGSGEKQKYYP